MTSTHFILICMYLHGSQVVATHGYNPPTTQSCQEAKAWELKMPAHDTDGPLDIRCTCPEDRGKVQ